MASEALHQTRGMEWGGDRKVDLLKYARCLCNNHSHTHHRDLLHTLCFFFRLKEPHFEHSIALD